MLLASLGDSFSSFFNAVGDFFSNLAAVSWPYLFGALIFFTVYLTLRARASFHILRAAYPDSKIEFRRIWGAYFAGYGFNAVIPARGGDIVVPYGTDWLEGYEEKMAAIKGYRPNLKAAE